MNLEEYRKNPKEQLRVGKLMDLIPYQGSIALDVGARDGFLSIKLADHFKKVIAIDLNQPNITHDKVEARIGDITCLEFLNDSFDLVLCAEVLEHIPTKLLSKACNELARVTKDYLIIGVPFDQDLRFGKTTCFSCNKTNPPWGHVNRFDLSNIADLFPGMKIVKADYVGATRFKTNFMSTFLMDLAKNPYGSYIQEESCVHCGKKLTLPPPRTLMQKVFTRLATYINNFQQLFITEQPNWIHVLLQKQCN
ncbi:MAG: class I SAM-dependent methyltransferase [Mucilaginibacter sp.]